MQIRELSVRSSLSNGPRRKIEDVKHRIFRCHGFGDVAEMGPIQTPEKATPT